MASDIEDNSTEQRSRLVTLVYKVLLKFVTPFAKDKDSWIYARLAIAFHKQAAEAAEEESAAEHSSSRSGHGAGRSSHGASSSTASRSPKDK